MLIFDEVKTGITAGCGGATGYFGVQPDLVTLAKSIGGGFPVGAFGGTPGVHGPDHRRQGAAPRHVQRQPAGAWRRPRPCSPRSAPPAPTDAAIARNDVLVDACQAIIERAGLPAHTVQFGAKGCVTWSPTPVRNYRDYKATDFDLAFAQWIHGINRGVLLPPGLDEQWLISVMHTEAEAMRYADVFDEFVDRAHRLTPAVASGPAALVAVAVIGTGDDHALRRRAAAAPIISAIPPATSTTPRRRRRAGRSRGDRRDRRHPRRCR